MAGKDERIIHIRVKTDLTDHEMKMRRMRVITEQATRKSGKALKRNWSKVASNSRQATRLLGREFALLSNVMVGAGAAAGPAGIAVGAIGAGAAIAAVGVVALGVALVEVADEARDLVVQAKKTPEFFNEADLKRLVETDDALGAVKLSVKGAAVTMATQLAPTIEMVSTAVVGASLFIQDFGEYIWDSGVSAVETTNKIYQLAMTVKMFAELDVFEMMKRLAMGESLVGLGAQDAIPPLFGMASELGGLSETADDYQSRAAKLIANFDDIKDSAGGARDVMAEFNAMLAIGDKVAAETADAESDLLDAQTKIYLAYEKRIQAVQELGGNEVAVAEAVAALAARRTRDTEAQIAEDEAAVAAAQEKADALLEIHKQMLIDKDLSDKKAATDSAEQRKAEQEQLIEGVISFGIMAADAMTATMDNIAKLAEGSSKKSLKRIAIAQKGFAIASAVMSGAQAAVAGFAPPPIGFGPTGGFAFLPFIAAQVATQIAVIGKSTGEVMHAGGGLNKASSGGGRGAPLAADEMSITAKDGEFVVNSMGRAAAGDGALNALNRGEAPGGAPVFALQLDHRYMSEFMARDIRLPGSTLGNALNQNSDIGYRRR